MSRYLLAHDLGTTGNKATLFSTDGELIAAETTPYETYYRGGNRVEQSPKEWWQAVCASTEAILKHIDPQAIAAVSFSGQMMGCLCVDSKGQPLRNALIYADQRGTEQADRLIAGVGWEEMYRITGHRPSASYSIAKLMWVRDNEPEIYASTAKSLQAKDFIVFKLTGRMVTDYSDASSTNAFDLNTLSWSDRVFEAADVPPDKFPEAVASTEVVGEVTSRAAAETGIPQGTPVVMGAGDGGCATVGAGSVRPGISYNYIGSSSWVATTSTQPLYDPEMRTFNWAHPISGYYQPTGTMQTAGSSFRWLQEEICRSETEEAQRRGVSPYELINALAQESTPAGHGVLFLPYFMGERTPWWNPEAKGGFIGLRLDTKRADLVRAVIDGVALNLNFSLQAVRHAAEPSGMIVIGGGAKGAIWRQTLADVYGLQIQVPRYLEEATSLGAAVIAGVGVGVFEDFDVVDRINGIDSRIDPRPEYSDAYRHMQGLLEESYRSLEDVFPKLHGEPGRNG